MDTPTDCPTRERSGWTGDIRIFSPTASLLVDCQNYLRRYLRNVAAEQLDDGRIPVFIPSGTSRFYPELKPPFRWMSGATGFGDVSVLLPWNVYLYFGDTQILERQLPSMKAWVDYLARTAKKKRGRGRWLSRRRGTHEDYIIDGGLHPGEWMRPGENMLHIAKLGIRPPAVVATAYLANSASTLAQICTILGYDEDARHYRELAENVKAAWQSAFVKKDGRIGADKQDDYVRALAFDLLPKESRDQALTRLVELIEKAGFHLGTGFFSTPMLLDVLADNGKAELAYRLLFQNTNPSWLYQVEKGATTVWETWEGFRKNGRGKWSHNHYAFGSVAAWLFQTVVGIRPLEPGYKKIEFRPVIPGTLNYAEAAIETPFGTASCRWEKSEDGLLVEVVVPPGATGIVNIGPYCSDILREGKSTIEINDYPSF